MIGPETFSKDGYSVVEIYLRQSVEGGTEKGKKKKKRGRGWKWKKKWNE